MAWDAAEKALQRMCDRYLYQWDRAVARGRPIPDGLILWEMIDALDLSPPGLGEALQYVTRCLVVTNSRPEEKQLMGNLLLRRFH